MRVLQPGGYREILVVRGYGAVLLRYREALGKLRAAARWHTSPYNWAADWQV